MTKEILPNSKNTQHNNNNYKHIDRLVVTLKRNSYCSYFILDIHTSNIIYLISNKNIGSF